MSDLSQAIVAKSDQLNSDDLISGPIIIRITRVTTKEGEQPVSIHYEGDNGKPYKPGKSMCRVLAQLWGTDGKRFVGRSLTLYRDPTVTFGKLAVGGIRISHMSDIDGTANLALTVTRGKKGAFVVKPLAVTTKPAATAPAETALAPTETATNEQEEFAANFRDECTELAGDLLKLEDLGKRVTANREKLGPLYQRVRDQVIAAFKAAK